MNNRSNTVVTVTGAASGTRRGIALPGFTLTEAIVVAIGGRPPGNDSIEFPRRAVKVPFAVPQVQRHSGKTMRAVDVAVKYGFQDIDWSGESSQDSSHGA